MPEAIFKKDVKKRIIKIDYLREVDFNNLHKQKCQIAKDLVYTKINSDSFILEEQEFMIHTFFNVVDEVKIEQKNVSCSVPYYMYKLLKNEHFFLTKVLTSVRAEDRILEIEGFLSKDARLIY